eukprot:NODE_738_length_1675_cov_50.569121_g728_i0.p1 GENE.NODE_738_length_1675_cov_50.569121_g728_i0~~NODE_738_length_1675_cov_50.569121_g728_i0.p1  ORF type:complete len:488 (+),score=131.26 NODE_738_length_1675_cov_50.569121_g728_i0:113-1465(+)
MEGSQAGDCNTQVAQSTAKVTTGTDFPTGFTHCYEFAVALTPGKTYHAMVHADGQSFKFRKGNSVATRQYPMGYIDGRRQKSSSPVAPFTTKATSADIKMHIDLECTGTDIVWDDCANIQCQLHASCLLLPNSDLCECEEPYSGPDCDIMDPCFDNDPCLNGGTCVNQYGSAICVCPSDYAGDYCADHVTSVCDAATQPCATPQDCSVKYNVAWCSACPTGKYGNSCDEDVPYVPPPSTCVPSDVSNCLVQVDTSDKCQSFRDYAQCALSNSCPEYVSVWCGSFFKTYPAFVDGSCAVTACTTTTGSCDIDMFQQCYVEVGQDASLTDDCAIDEAYVQCGVDSRCPDLIRFKCQRSTVDACGITTCPQVYDDEVVDFGANLMGMIPGYSSHARPAARATQPPVLAIGLIAAGCVAAVLLAVGLILRSRRRVAATTLDADTYVELESGSTA